MICITKTQAVAFVQVYIQTSKFAYICRFSRMSQVKGLKLNNWWNSGSSTIEKQWFRRAIHSNILWLKSNLVLIFTPFSPGWWASMCFVMLLMVNFFSKYPKNSFGQCLHFTESGEVKSAWFQPQEVSTFHWCCLQKN